MNAHVIARCAKCREPLPPGGVCRSLKCLPLEAALERLRPYVREPRRKQAKRQFRAANSVRDALGGQDAALPPSDR